MNAIPQASNKQIEQERDAFVNRMLAATAGVFDNYMAPMAQVGCKCRASCV
jgi:hypothetical protein